MHLLTGGTGYVGGRLLRRLEQDGLSVRCLCRNPEALRWRVAPGTELVRGGILSGLLYWYLLWPIHEVMFRGR